MGDVMPVRNSTNPVEGINRCECGQVRTIHRARGKRSKFLYSICDDCGTNQQTGVFWQNRFKAHFPTIEALAESEQASNNVVCEPKTDTEQVANIEPKEPESLTQETPETLPNTSHQGGDSEATRTETATGTSRTKPSEPTKSEEKPSTWKAIVAGIFIGALTGGAIARF